MSDKIIEHPKQLFVSGFIAVIVAIIAGGPGWYGVLTEDGADPSIVDATVIWTRQVEAVSLFQGPGIPSDVQEFNFIGNEATFHATVTNDGGKSTTVVHAKLTSFQSSTIELDVTLTVLAHDKGEMVASIRPNKISRDATARKSCAVEEGKCLNDEPLPQYRLEIEFDPGGVRFLDVEAQFLYEVTATCPTEEAEPAPVAACLSGVR